MQYHDMQNGEEPQEPAGNADLATIEDLCFEQRRIVKQIEELSKLKENLTDQILSLMTSDKVVTTNYKITKIRQISVKTSLDCARALGCTVMQEEIDKDALRKLYQKGVTVPDVKENEWIRIMAK